MLDILYAFISQYPLTNRNAIIENWEPDEKQTTVSTTSSKNDCYLRYGYSSWEALEEAFINKRSA